MTSHWGGGSGVPRGGGTCRGVGRTELGGGSRGGPTTVDCPPKALASRFYPIRPMYNFFFWGGGGSGQPGTPLATPLGRGGGAGERHGRKPWRWRPPSLYRS